MYSSKDRTVGYKQIFRSQTSHLPNPWQFLVNMEGTDQKIRHAAKYKQRSKERSMQITKEAL
jgi:hypothetical protein